MRTFGGLLFFAGSIAIIGVGVSMYSQLVILLPVGINPDFSAVAIIAVLAGFPVAGAVLLAGGAIIDAIKNEGQAIRSALDNKGVAQEGTIL